MGLMIPAALWALEDPFRPADYTGPVSRYALQGSESASLQLNSILVGSDRRVAVVNNMAYEVGDRVGSHVLARIDEEGVLLFGEEKSLYLDLFPSNFKTIMSRPSGLKRKDPYEKP